MGHTMREVAKRAGVSPATVSRVLNKTHYISVETERRVLEVVGQMKYFKNVHARRLATGRSDLFGLVISEIANPYFPEMIHGFQAAAWGRGDDLFDRQEHGFGTHRRGNWRGVLQREPGREAAEHHFDRLSAGYRAGHRAYRRPRSPLRRGHCWTGRQPDGHNNQGRAGCRIEKERPQPITSDQQ